VIQLSKFGMNIMPNFGTITLADIAGARRA
jgi:hypothetical protein